MSNWLSPLRVLSCIRGAYPDGIVPGADYPALLSVLHQRMNADDVIRVATELVVWGASPLSSSARVDVAELARLVSPTEAQRVTELLRGAGWVPDGTGSHAAP